MINKGIFDGDIAVIRKTNNVENESDYNEIVKNESKFQFRFANKIIY